VLQKVTFFFLFLNIVEVLFENKMFLRNKNFFQNIQAFSKIRKAFSYKEVHDHR
jgi:hypothetical protein